MIAVIKKAVQLDSKYTPRDIQILSVLIMMDSKNKGRLLQIYTGEGKSTTISILATIKALQGNKVDILTSSEILAERDSKEKSKFYESFNLTCAHNTYDQDEPGPKDCYLKDIVYGDTGSFEGDILRDEYELYGTLCNRKPEIMIVDEVDNMLIDNKSHSTMLASAKPGMKSLIPLMQKIWGELIRISPLMNKDGSGVILNPINSNEYKEVDDVASYLEKEYSLNLINGENPLISIPEYRRDFVLHQLPKWIKSAISAHQDFTKGIQYKIKNREIAPVDYINTGVTQENTQWPNGIHQFLQMKEGLDVTPETLTTNYLSNVSFFNRYKQNIYGLTGTLGSIPAQKLLAETYDVDFGFIPPFKPRQLKELPTIVALSKNEWLQSIIKNTIKEANNNRAVLAIFENENDAKEIYHQLCNNYTGKIILYTDNEGSEIENITVKPGQVIIATNLAGRGTDIKTSEEVEDAGGLHVFVTFLPLNLRVEEQAFGRTARQGKLGTAQLVLNFDSDNIRRGLDKQGVMAHMLIQGGYINAEIDLDIVKELMMSNHGNIKKQRDDCEKHNLLEANKEIKNILLKDQLFKEFCNLLTQLPDIRKNRFIFKDIEGVLCGKVRIFSA